MGRAASAFELLLRPFAIRGEFAMVLYAGSVRSGRVPICGRRVCFARDHNRIGWLTLRRDINWRPKDTSGFLGRLLKLLNNILDTALSWIAIDCHTP